jgi:glutamine phosphoribosylpyrophosphate amidotransferase
MSISEADATTLDVVSLATAMLDGIQSRGMHATGVAWGDAEGVWWDKAAMPGGEYARTRMPLSPLATTVILHTRYATGGWEARPSVNENNHPFALPGVTGTHNGVLWNPEELYALVGAEPEVPTDSAALFAALAYRPEGMNRVDVLRQVAGDAAVAWIETEHPGRLYLARLSGRPLAVARTSGGSLVYASTKPLLLGACRTAGVEVRDANEVPEWSYAVIEGGRPTRVDRIRPEADRAPLYRTPRRADLRAVNPRLRLGVTA